MGKKARSYDPAIRQTEHGSRLYAAWVRINKFPHCKEWECFPTFYEWAMENGYEVGTWLNRDDNDKPYSPDNCIWYKPQSDGISPEWAEWIKRWNKTVNRIRKHYGMPPLEEENIG